MAKKGTASAANPTASPGQPTATPRDPQPSVDRIDDLARRILNSDILLPKFQRDFVWERPQVLNLWDSVSKGYPIGSILLWESSQKLASQNQIADLPITGPRPNYPVNYLLDGQQRLSSICGAMYWAGTDPESPWNIAYDLRHDKFLHLDTLDDPPPHQIRVNRLADPSLYFKHVLGLESLTAPDKELLKKRANDLFNRFKDYKIAAVTLGDMSIQDVAPIFERINSQGTPLTIVDLMRAATWSPDFDLIDSIESILSDLKAKGFDKVDKKIVLRNLNVSMGGGFSANNISDHLRKHTPIQLKAGVEATREAYKKTVDFLSTQIGIPSSHVLPYGNQLVVLTEVFRQIPFPSATQFQAISRWFWRTSHSEYFGGWNTGMMSRDLEAIKKFASGETEIKMEGVKPLPSTWIEKSFRLNNAHSKLLGIILGHCEPLDLLTQQRIDVSGPLDWSNAKEFHHFFPQDYLSKQGLGSGEINCLANIVLLTSGSNKTISATAPSEYLKKVAIAAGTNLDQLLASNLIPRLAYEAALKNDYQGFLKLRADAIHEYVVKRAEW